MTKEKLIRMTLAVLLGLSFALPGAGAALAAPSNDNFADAKAITLPFFETIDITEATTEAGEPECYYGQRTVWYRITAEENGMLTIDYSGSSFTQTMVALWRATSPEPAGFSDLSLVRCDTFSPYYPFMVYLQAGETYYVQAGSVADATGLLALDFSFVPPPPNDDRANATPIVLTDGTFTDVVNTSAATSTADDPLDPYCTTFRSVWYTITPSTDLWVWLDTTASNFTTMMHVYADQGGSLQLVGQYCGNVQTVLTLAAGTTYYIMIGGYYWYTPNYGLVNFTVTEITHPFPPDATVSADAIAYVDAQGTVTVRGSVTCSGPGDFNVSGHLRQVFARRLIAEGYGSTVLSCGPEPHGWEMTFSSYPVLFGAGKASLELFWHTCAPAGCTDEQGTTNTITVRRSTR